MEIQVSLQEKAYYSPGASNEHDNCALFTDENYEDRYASAITAGRYPEENEFFDQAVATPFQRLRMWGVLAVSVYGVSRVVSGVNPVEEVKHAVERVVEVFRPAPEFTQPSLSMRSAENGYYLNAADMEYVKELSAQVVLTPDKFRNLQIDTSHLGVFDDELGFVDAQPIAFVGHWTGKRYENGVEQFISSIKGRRGNCCNVMYFIDDNAQIYQFFTNPKQRAAHAAGFNMESQGVEIEAAGLRDYTPAELESFSLLTLKFLMDNNLEVSRRSILGHAEVDKRFNDDPSGKVDMPPELLDQLFPKIAQLAVEVGYGDRVVSIADARAMYTPLSELQANEKLASFIPQEQIGMYYNAAQEFGVDWRDVAMIVWLEHHSYTNGGFQALDPHSDEWASSGAGAKGPGQFMDRTAEGLKVRYPQLADIDHTNDFEGSMRMIAAYLKDMSGGKKTAPELLALRYNAGGGTFIKDDQYVYKSKGELKVWPNKKQKEIAQYVAEAGNFRRLIDAVLNAA